jgi:hypothetical protein
LILFAIEAILLLNVSADNMVPPLIALEEHFYSKAVFSSIGEKFQFTLKAVPGLSEQLLDLGDGRLAAMDRGNISLQVISHAFTPGNGTLLIPVGPHG